MIQESKLQYFKLTTQCVSSSDCFAVCSLHTRLKYNGMIWPWPLRVGCDLTPSDRADDIWGWGGGHWEITTAQTTRHTRLRLLWCARARCGWVKERSQSTRHSWPRSCIALTSHGDSNAADRVRQNTGKWLLYLSGVFESIDQNAVFLFFFLFFF